MRTLVSALLLVALAGSATAQPRILRVDEDTPRWRDHNDGAEQVAAAPAPPPPPTVAVRGVELRGLDTLNGTTRDLRLAVGETVRFGHLEVAADACRVPEDDPEGDAQAFLRIRDIREDEPRFTGWMFASSPALSALDHPRYDVWVLSCSNR